MAGESDTTADPTTPYRGRRFTILITDDDPGSRETLAGLLADRGFQAVQAKSGEEAIEIVRVEIIHLVFFDMHMPRMTGLEALEQVRMLNEMLPAILVTGGATRQLIRQAFQAQVFSVIPKPVNKNIVLHTLTRALATVYGGQPDAPAPPTEPTATP
ncbi:MAG: response regulator [Fimbriiglobus sp.]